jgi:hypothetical protein
MTKTQKDNLFRLISLAIVIFVYVYIIVSRVGFHKYYNDITDKQQQIITNQKIIIDNEKLLLERR